MPLPPPAWRHTPRAPRSTPPPCSPLGAPELEPAYYSYFTLLNVRNEHKGDATARPSTFQISAIYNSPPASLHVPSRTPTDISPRTFDSVDIVSGTSTSTKNFPWASTEKDSGVLTRTQTTSVYLYFYLLKFLLITARMTFLFFSL